MQSLGPVYVFATAIAKQRSAAAEQINGKNCIQIRITTTPIDIRQKRNDSINQLLCYVAVFRWQSIESRTRAAAVCKVFKFPWFPSARLPFWDFLPFLPCFSLLLRCCGEFPAFCPVLCLLFPKIPVSSVIEHTFGYPTQVSQRLEVICIGTTPSTFCATTSTFGPASSTLPIASNCLAKDAHTPPLIYCIFHHRHCPDGWTARNSMHSICNHKMYVCGFLLHDISLHWQDIHFMNHEFMNMLTHTN